MPFVALVLALMMVDSPLAGTWTADLSRSKLHRNSAVQSTTLRFEVTDDAVSITDTVITSSGQDIGHGTTTFQADGKAHPHDDLMPGLVVVAKWTDSHTFETVLTRRNGIVDRVTYQVSADGRP
jgi:hypothetical protein